jgi:hypothetical protein
VIREKLTVQAGQQVAWQLVEALQSGPVYINDERLNTKFQKAAINFLRRIAEAEPKVIRDLFSKPIPKESGERPA